MREIDAVLIEVLNADDADHERTADLYCKTLARLDPKHHRRATILFMCLRWDGWCRAHFSKYPATDAEIEEGVENALAWARRQLTLAMRLH